MLNLFALLGLLVEKAHAASPYYSLYCDALGTYYGDGQGFLIHLAARTANVIVVPVVGGVAVIAILWASIKMQSSFGEDQGKEDAKKIIIGTLIGIVLAVTGAAIVSWACRAVQVATGGTLPCN